MESAAYGIKQAWADMSPQEKAGIGAAIAGAAAATISNIANIKAAASRRVVAGIDKEIEAEKKRDGKSAQSLKKIETLERKKEAQKRKQFETDKKLRIGETIMNTAAGMMLAVNTAGNIYVGLALAALTATMGMAQVAAISATSYGGGGSISANKQPTKIQIGERENKVDVSKGRGNVMGELAYLRGERGTGSSASDFRPGGFAGRKYRAAGGMVVGEQGPELFVPRVPGEVMSRSDLMGREVPMNITFQINAIDTANMEEMLETRQGSIISMIRAAANEHGQDFLEMIDTDTYNEDQRVAGGPLRSYE